MKKQFNKDKITLISNCGHCSYKWLSRVSNPKACPRCKTRLDYVRNKIVDVREMLGGIELKETGGGGGG